MSTPAPEPDPSREDALWREIVANYGDQPEPDLPPADPAPERGPVSSWVVPSPQPLPSAYDDEHYVPPPPPPVSYPTGRRALAWFGLFGGPVVLLVLVVLPIYVPSWFNWLVFFGFVAGFGYLVATLPRRDEDGWDDHSRI